MGAAAPVFAEPWQAEAFAMTIALHEQGLFSWNEWADALAGECAQPLLNPDGHDYYECWLRALEGLIVGKGVANTAQVEALAGAWQRAALATPHGAPIRLENDPLG